ncbi:organic solvent ABC transporter permease [Marinobacter sp.]|uniref:organic solvent ABC transporter permease n=1 Tax=Marinobacter sp. TaxID=50741 RepID=UPI00384F93B7
MKLVHITLLSLIALSGCSDDSDSSDDDRSTGQITPTGISGLSYSTASQSGITDSRGRFRYYPGEQLSLRVGDLELFSGIPARDFVTPLDFDAQIRSQLDQASLTDEGLLSHRPTEQRLFSQNVVMNTTRLLLALGWRTDLRDGRAIDIRQRVITQLNEALPNLSAPIDFSVPPAAFASGGDEPSPANQLLNEICFFPPQSELCEEPPTLEEVEIAPDVPEDPTKRLEDVEYKQDLESKRKRILGAIREVDDISEDKVEEYLTRELDIVTVGRGNRYLLNASTASHPASDTSIKTVKIRRVGGQPNLEELEVLNTNEVDIVVHAFNELTADVDYFVAGPSGKEGTLLINFKPAGDYRWVKKQLRVIIQ